MRYRLRNCCLQGLKIRSMETKRFRLRLLISQACLGETRRAELCTGSTATVLGLPPPWHPAFTAPDSLVPKDGRAPGCLCQGFKSTSRQSVARSGWELRGAVFCTPWAVGCFSPKAEMWERGCACVCVGRSEPGGELLPLHCKLFGGELIHFLGSGISYSLNIFLFPPLLVLQAQRHKGDKCGTDFLWLTC